MTPAGSPVRWGVMGTGQVAAKFVLDLQHAQHTAVVEAVASRTPANAEAFARAYGAGRAVTYEAMAGLALDAVYVATPASQHREHATACLEAGIPVLVEKPIASDAADAAALVEVARANGVFLMEGLWTRFLPAFDAAVGVVRGGAIGRVRAVHGAFGTRSSNAGNLLDPALGGGALLHRGIYPLGLASVFAGPSTYVAADFRTGETGVDVDATLIARHRDGCLSTSVASVDANLTNQLTVTGETGELTLVGPMFRPLGYALRTGGERASEGRGSARKTKVRESHRAQRLQQAVRGPWGSRLLSRPPRAVPYSGNGYHYEADELWRNVTAGRLESDALPLDDTVATIRTIETALQEAGT